MGSPPWKESKESNNPRILAPHPTYSLRPLLALSIGLRSRFRERKKVDAMMAVLITIIFRVPVGRIPGSRVDGARRHFRLLGSHGCCILQALDMRVTTPSGAAPNIAELDSSSLIHRPSTTAGEKRKRNRGQPKGHWTLLSPGEREMEKHDVVIIHGTRHVSLGCGPWGGYSRTTIDSFESLKHDRPNSG